MRASQSCAPTLSDTIIHRMALKTRNSTYRKVLRKMEDWRFKFEQLKLLPFALFCTISAFKDKLAVIKPNPPKNNNEYH